MSTIDLLDLGSLYVADFIKDDESPRHPSAPLLLQMDEDTGAVRLKDVVDPSYMYGKYWYRSGINDSMRADLEDVVKSVLKVKKLNATDVWLDIASNDGTLLSFVRALAPNVTTLGIDPVDDSFKVEAQRHGEIIQDFFSKKAYASSAASWHGRAAAITCIAMFYDLDDPLPFLEDVHEVLQDDGVFVIQASYTPLMIEQLAFDNICHEHAYYYTAESLNHFLDAAGFQIMDIQLNDTNGGSFRVFCMKKGANITKFGSQPHRDVCLMRTASIFDLEREWGYNSPLIWTEFRHRLSDLKANVVGYVKAAVARGETVAFLGASTKGSTLAQYFGLDDSLISYAVERSPAKWGRKMVGVNVPIISEEEMRANPPDVLILLPWCFVQNVLERERQYLLNGGKLLVPCPQLKVFTAADL